jgi:hypothetical protein
MDTEVISERELCSRHLESESSHYPKLYMQHAPRVEEASPTASETVHISTGNTRCVLASIRHAEGHELDEMIGPTYLPMMTMTAVVDVRNIPKWLTSYQQIKRRAVVIVRKTPVTRLARLTLPDASPRVGNICHVIHPR